MRTVITSTLSAGFVLAGALGGQALRPEPLAPSSTPADGAEADEGGVPGIARPERENGMMTMRFSRPFVVPVSDGWRTQSLVILTVSIELDRALAEGMGGLENRLRDRIMASLVTFAHDGGFAGEVVDPSVYSGVEETVATGAGAIFGDGVGAVTIVEMVKRDT